MKLSMIVVITSCAPNFALRTPGTPATTPPPAAAAIKYNGNVSSAGNPDGSNKPTIAATSSATTAGRIASSNAVRRAVRSTGGAIDGNSVVLSVAVVVTRRA